MSDSRVPFVCCWLTPRWKDGVVSAWFMHCTNPAHTKAGVSCTKEVSIKAAGSEDRALRLVKSWIVFASESTTTKADHVACWNHIAKVDVSPSDAELEAAAPADWPDVNIDEATLEMTSDEGAIPTSRGSTKRALTENVPNDVHQAAVAMWQAGELCETTPEQRQRNGRCAGVNYGTPHRYAQLLRYGYLGPNLPPPTSYHWACRPGTWILLPRGG